MISSDEARMIINKWNQESTLLRCDLVTDGGMRLYLVGKIDLLTDDGFGIRASDQANWATFPFREVQYYDYGDHRVVARDEGLRDYLADTFEAMLTLRTGYALVALGELKKSATQN